MSLEVVEADEHIGIHDSTTNLCLLYILTTSNWHFHFVCTFQTITNQNRTAYSEGSESVFPCTIEMFEGILSATRIEGVTVGQERATTQFLHYVYHGTGIVRAKVGDVAQFAEVHLDCYKLAF